VNGRWRSGGTYVLDGSIVGVATKDAFDRGWWAYGCMAEWQDTELGLYPTQRKAERAVEKWVHNAQRESA
jgi:hypothetical protein